MSTLETSAAVPMLWREVTRPGRDRVLLRRFSLDSFDTERSREAILSAEELQRASRLRRERDGRRFLAGRAFVRKSLGELLGVAPGEIVFGAGAFGKPEILSPATTLSFSLAHAEGEALLAVAFRGRVGVDIEARDAAPDVDALAARALAPEELRQLRRLPAQEREAFFLARWTMKEALLKAAGVGLSSDPSRIVLEAGEEGSFTARGEPATEGLEAWLVDAGPGFLAALAAEASLSS